MHNTNQNILTMASVNISLIGGQPMPVHMGLLDRKYDYVVFVHSKETKENAEAIKKVGNYPAGLYEIHAVDYASFMPLLKALLAQYQDDEVYVNVSGGTKIWSVALALEAIKHDNVHPFYVDQNGNYLDVKTGKSHVIDCNLNIDTMLRYHLQPASSHTPLTDYTREDIRVLEEVKKARKINVTSFNELTIFKLNGNVGNTVFPISIYNGSSIDYDKTTGTVNLSITTYNGYNSRSYRFASPHAKDIVFASGWFEFEVAKALSRVPTVAEVWLNVVIPYEKMNAKNEIDIICKIGNKLLFVECKTKIKDNTDIDKFNSAVKNFGGMACKSLFVSNTKMNDMTIEKCKDNNILYFSKFEGKDEDCKVLGDLLDKYVNQINKR